MSQDVSHVVDAMPAIDPTRSWGAPIRCDATIAHLLGKSWYLPRINFDEAIVQERDCNTRKIGFEEVVHGTCRR